MNNLKKSLAFLFICIAFLSQAQTIKVTSYIEQTHVSPKIGTSVTNEFDNYLEVGIFYQKSTVEHVAEFGRPLTMENEFTGVYTAFPIYVGYVTVVKVGTRTGIVNQEHFRITPSISGDYYPLANLALSMGIGVNNLRPTIQAGIKLSIN